MRRLTIFIGAALVLLGACDRGSQTPAHGPVPHVPTPNPPFILKLNAPAIVLTDATFEVGFIPPDAPPRNLVSGAFAVMWDGKHEWVLVDGPAFRPRNDIGYSAAGRGGYGPWPFRAPPVAGKYRICMKASGITACAPVEVTKNAKRAAGQPSITASPTAAPPTYHLSLDAPRSVKAGATFEVRLVTDAPQGMPESAIVALLKRDGKPVWWITDREAVRALRFIGNDWTPRPYHGPWIFKAPPEAGAFELCMEAGIRACASIEVTAA